MEKSRNEYVPTDVHWSEVPGRDAVWKEQTIANTSEQQFKIEFECEFLGSVDTLIAPSKLKALVFDKPLNSNGWVRYSCCQKTDTIMLLLLMLHGVLVTITLLCCG